jgi:hypothetical protein
MTAKAAKILDTIEKEVYVDLSADEVRVKGEELAHLDLQVMQEEDALKEHVKGEKSRIKELVLQLHKLSETVRQRRELRITLVDIVDAGEGRVNEVRQDSAEVIRTRPMTEVEKQRLLPNIGKVASGEEKA